MNKKITNSALSDPPVRILHTSGSLVWRDVVVEKRYHAAGEYVFPSSSSHLICLHQGPPVFIEQVRNGQFFSGTLARGNSQIFSAGAEITWQHQEGADHMHVLLPPALLQRVAEDYNQPHIELLDQLKTCDTRIKNLSSALLTELLEGGPSGRVYVDGIITALAAHLIHSYTSTPHALPEITKGLSPFLLRKTTTLIEDRLAEDIGLAELSAEAGLSPSHFSSLFRKATGLSPHTYIVQHRLERAQHLLRSTKLSISEIAITVGFYDQSHLVRHMRKVMGVTPSYIRNHLY